MGSISLDRSTERTMRGKFVNWGLFAFAATIILLGATAAQAAPAVRLNSAEWKVIQADNAPECAANSPASDDWKGAQVKGASIVTWFWPKSDAQAGQPVKFILLFGDSA